MRILLVLLLLAAVFSGCATTPIRSSDAQPVPTDRLLAFQEKSEKTPSRIVITRDVGFTGSACYLVVRINGKDAVRIDVGETAIFSVEPGESLLSVVLDPLGKGLCRASLDPGRGTTREVYLKAGEWKYFRLKLDQFGGMDIVRSEEP